MGQREKVIWEKVSWVRVEEKVWFLSEGTGSVTCSVRSGLGWLERKQIGEWRTTRLRGDNLTQRAAVTRSRGDDLTQRRTRRSRGRRRWSDSVQSLALYLSRFSLSLGMLALSCPFALAWCEWAERMIRNFLRRVKMV